MRVVVKEIDEYRVDPPQFVAIDLQSQKIAKAWPFPKELEQASASTRPIKSPPTANCYTFFRTMS